MNLRIVGLLAFVLATATSWAAPVKVETGDVVVFAGVLKRQTAIAAMTATTAEQFGEYEILIHSDVYVRNKRTGEMEPGQMVGRMFATPADVGVGPRIEEGHNMTFAGVVSYDGHITIHEVISNSMVELPATALENSPVPSAPDHLGRATRVPYLRVLDGDRVGPKCEATLDPTVRERIHIVK